ncbi:MAG: rubrerythrin family protein, partial [Oscillospiraceae bacterium]
FPPHAYLWALFSMLIIVVLIIVVFNYYIAVAKDLPFKKRFCEMAAISLGVAGLSFVIGIFVKKVLGVEM